MIKYICNLCKADIKTKDMVVIKTQIDDKVKTVHLHKNCLSNIEKVCSDVFQEEKVKHKAEEKAKHKAEEKKNKEPIMRNNEQVQAQVHEQVHEQAQVHEQKTEERIDTDSNKKSNEQKEKIRLSDEEFDAVLNALSNENTLNNDREKRVNKPVTGLDVKLDGLCESLTKSKPRDVKNIQRILLCVYKGISYKDTSNLVKTAYQNVILTRKKYGCIEIAKRHMKPERMKDVTCKVIDTFIKYGSITNVISETHMSKDAIEEILTYYTGF